MNSNTEKSQRIAKNTLLLYFRTFIVLLISLYTSRVILRTLGVEDFGIYNVVGGVIVMLGYLTNSLSAASSRYITYDLGKGDLKQMKTTFGNILTIHFIMAGIIILIAETAGLWFVNTQLNIPIERQNAAMWVYQFAILSSAIALIGVPYNSAIIAHEKMSAFAYISILDVVLKLVIASILPFIPYDRLIIYSFLFLCIQFFDRIMYGVYCTKHFKETTAPLYYNKKVFKEIFTFAGWTMNGNLAAMGFSQGLNMLLNIFYGPVVNAARGIAIQVQSATQQFCSNFQMALNPQLTKSYAQGNLDYMHKLLIKSSKFSFYILLFIVLPLMFEAEFVLKIWLGIVPEHTANFLRLILITGLLYTLANPIIVSVHATGNIKKFQIIEGCMLLTIVPIAYLLLKLTKVPPESVFVVHIIVEICTQYVRLKIVLPMINLKFSTYIKQVISPILLVIILSPLIPFTVHHYINQGDWETFLEMCIICVLCTSFIIYKLGCTASERKFLLERIKAFSQKIVCK